MGILILGLTLGMTCKKKNQPPGAPSIPSGPSSGRKGDTLRFSTVAEDPDGDSVAVRFDWGDSTMSDWSGLVPSGDSVVMTHVWQRLSSYSIRAQAKDSNETASVWSAEHQLTVASFFTTFGGPGDDVGNSVQQTSDGGYIVAGSTKSYGAGNYDVWLVKADASGNKVWDRTFGGTGWEEGNSVQQTTDGGYVIAGTTTSYGAGGADVWLIKTDVNGNEVWDRTFGGAGDDFGCSTQQTLDGGYIIIGITQSHGGSGEGAWLIKTDASGNEVWNRTLGGDWGNSVQQTSDGGYIVTGYTTASGSGGKDVWLVKTDSTGNRMWDTTFGGPDDEEGYSVRQTFDGGYVIAGWTPPQVGYGEYVWLIKTDGTGHWVWDRSFGATHDGEGRSVQQTSDAGYVIGGYEGSYVWLIKTDSAGNKLWDKLIRQTDYDTGHSVQKTSDGGYVMTGTTESGVPSCDVLLVKTDAEGN